MGLMGGGPGAVGAAVGRQFTSAAMSVVFLTPAAGSIIYLIRQPPGRRAAAGHRGGLLSCFLMLVICRGP